MKKKIQWIVISGLVWLAVGFFLLFMGLKHTVHAALDVNEHTIFFSKLSALVGGAEQASLLIVSLGLVIGFLKGRMVLAKTVRRVVDRILALPLPIQFTQVYARGYLFLIGGMVMLGVVMKWMPADVRGLIDVAVGCALLNGSMLYFRQAMALAKATRLN